MFTDNYSNNNNGRGGYPEMPGEIERQYAEGKYPFGIGHVEDVANMIVYLSAGQSKWITGQNYIIDCSSF